MAQLPGEEEDEPTIPDDGRCEIVFQEDPDHEESQNEEEQSQDDASILTLVDHVDSVYSVGFRQQALQDGSIIFASGGGDDLAYCYHYIIGSDPRIFPLRGHTDSINVISFSPDGSILATGGLEGRVLTWDPTTGLQIATLTGPTDSIEWLSWHPTLPAILAGDRSGLMWLWNAKSGKCAKVYSQHQGPVTTGGFRPDGSEIWSAGEDKILRTWSVRAGEPTASIHGQAFHRAPISTGTCSPNGALMATADLSGVVKIVRFDETRILGSMDAGEHSIESVCFSPDNRWLAVASMGGTATIWNPQDFQVRHALSHPAGVTSIRWHPRRPYIITGCCDGAVRVWDARNGEILTEMAGHGDVITGIDIRGADTAEGDLLIITASDDRTVKIWSFLEPQGTH